VQDGEESDLGAEPRGFGSHFEKGLGTGLEQQIQQWPRRSERQRVQFMRHGENHVEVVGVKQVALLRFEPSPALLRLALGTASRSAGVIGVGCLVLAVGTLVLVSAQSCGTAALHGPIYLQLLIADSGLEAFQKLPSLRTDDVGHFDGRSRHGCRGL
jgi:hypothetical protein